MILYHVTNGRSTSPASLASCKGQHGRHTVIEVRDKPLPDSFNVALNCPEPYFVIAGDDFILHPRALNYIESVVAQSQPFGIRCWRLWDTLLERSIEGIKCYNTAAMLTVGGFRPNHLGKVDNNIWFDLVSAGYENMKDDLSVVGLHVHGTPQDLYRYEILWGHQKRYRRYYWGVKPLEEQLRLGRRDATISNIGANSDFYQYCKEMENPTPTERSELMSEANNHKSSIINHQS